MAVARDATYTLRRSIAITVAGCYKPSAIVRPRYAAVAYKLSHCDWSPSSNIGCARALEHQFGPDRYCRAHASQTISAGLDLAVRKSWNLESFMSLILLYVSTSRPDYLTALVVSRLLLVLLTTPGLPQLGTMRDSNSNYVVCSSQALHLPQRPQAVLTCTCGCS